MAEFRVDTARIQSSAGEISRIAGTIGNYPESVRRIARSLRLGSSGSYGISSQLQGLADVISQQAENTAKLGNALSTISQKYQSTEATIVSNKSTAGGNGAFGSSGTGSGHGGSGGSIDPAEKVTSVAWISGKLAGSGKPLGVNSSGELSGELFGASYKTKYTSGAKWKDSNGKQVIDSISLISAAVAGEAHVAKGSAKGNFGYLRGNADATVGEVSATGSVDVSLMKDGKIAPRVSGKVEAAAVGAKGSAEGGVGTENNNVHVGAEGKAGVAKASAEVGAGTIYVKNNDGTESKQYGVKAEAGAEAYLAEGKVSGGLTILGVKLNVGAGGKLGGAGAKAGGSVTNGGVSGSASLGLGVGLQLDFSVDWSGFKWKW